MSALQSFGLRRGVGVNDVEVDCLPGWSRQKNGAACFRLFEVPLARIEATHFCQQEFDAVLPSE